MGTWTYVGLKSFELSTRLVINPYSALKHSSAETGAWREKKCMKPSPFPRSIRNTLIRQNSGEVAITVVNPVRSGSPEVDLVDMHEQRIQFVIYRTASTLCAQCVVAYTDIMRP